MNEWMKLTAYILGVTALGVVFGSTVFGIIWVIRDFCVAHAIRFLQIPADFGLQLWEIFAFAGVLTMFWQIWFSKKETES